MASAISIIKMSNGVDLPTLGLGTFLANDPEKLKQALEVAITAGYRYFDTAQFYLNEDVLGDFLEEKFRTTSLKRKDVFITSKLCAAFHRPDLAEKAIEESLKRLKTDYIDLMLIHVPYPIKPSHDGFDFERDIKEITSSIVTGKEDEPELTPHIETWRILEKFYKLGKLKSIGLSNFSEAQIQSLINQAEVKPRNLQVECHIYLPQNNLFEFCKSHGITMTSYATIGSRGRRSVKDDDPNPLEDPLVIELAKKYGKTPAQILLRHMIQRGINVIPKSTTPERVRENIDIFDFTISEEEMESLSEIETRKRYFDAPFAKNHPYYPFGKV